MASVSEDVGAFREEFGGEVVVAGDPGYAGGASSSPSSSAATRTSGRRSFPPEPRRHVDVRF
jgi:hypothetical protein